jgi:UDP-N-acetylglucosamine--N-acetylmuramyl-(pentapeptide) pyrophosphoryl-undecaprenol N-acetylglucosamine transferase
MEFIHDEKFAIEVHNAWGAEIESDWLSSNWDEIWRKARNYQPTPAAQFSASEIIGSEIIRVIDGSK